MCELDERVWATLRRWGRKGMNEAILWSVLSGEKPHVSVAACAAAVERLIQAGRLYRDVRRTRTYLKTARARPADPSPPGLWEVA